MSDYMWIAPVGRPLRVTIFTRISTNKQDLASLDAQENLCRNEIARIFGPNASIEWNVMRSQGSGERLDRPELLKLEDIIENRQTDVIIAEDLGRIMRLTRAQAMCEDCEDANIRLIAINDRIDTIGKWKLAAMFASYKHEEANADTSERLQRQLDYNFMQGYCIQHRPLGLDLKPGSRHDSDLSWDLKLKQLYRVMWYLAERKPVLQITRWLQSRGVNLNNKQVGRLLSNRIFMGERTRGATEGRRDNKSGRRKRVKADPSKLLIRPVPHLQIITRERFERVQRYRQMIGDKFTVGADGSPDPRKGRPKKLTAFPGQRVCCGICGQLFYWGGNGQSDHMMCSGGRASAANPCWVKASFDGNLARERIVAAILAEVEKLEDFDDAFADLVRQEAEKVEDEGGDRIAALHKEISSVEKQIANVVAAVKQGLLVEQFAKEGKDLECRKNALQMELDQLERKPRSLLQIPTGEEMRILARRNLADVLNRPNDVSDLVDRLISRIVVLPHRPIDHGDVVFRATVEIDLAALITFDRALSDQLNTLRRQPTIDLFDPPQRIAIRKQALAIRASSPTLTHEQIAKKIGDVTDTAVQRAFKLDALMHSLNVSDEYEVVKAPHSVLATTLKVPTTTTNAA